MRQMRYPDVELENVTSGHALQFWSTAGYMRPAWQYSGLTGHVTNITISAKNINALELLDEICRQGGLEWHLTPEGVNVHPKKDPAIEKSQKNALPPKLVDVLIRHIRRVGPDEDAAQFIATERFVSWDRREEIADATIPYLKGSKPSDVGGALAVLYRLRSYRPMHDILSRDGGLSAWEQKYKPDPFWADLDRAVLRHAEHYLSFSEHDLLRNFSLYLASARSEEARTCLWRIVREKEKNGQALICLSWLGNKSDMDELYPYMLRDLSLPYQFLRNYGEDAIPYVEKAITETDSEQVRKTAIQDLKVFRHAIEEQQRHVEQ